MGLQKVGISNYTRGNEDMETWRRGCFYSRGGNGSSETVHEPWWGWLREEWREVKGLTLLFHIILTGLSSQSELNFHTPWEIMYDFK